MSMMDWTEYRKQLQGSIAELGRANPDAIRGYRSLVGAHSTKGSLDAKTRELVALAVAVTLRCDGCIATHTELARKHGASVEEIADALGIAMMVNTGATLVYSARTLDAFHNAEASAAQAATPVSTDKPNAE
jgi:AhpD family alkylhydroperoxidase